MIKGQPPSATPAPWQLERPRPSQRDAATKQIIGLLQRDGRRPFAEIAAEVGLDEDEVERRVDALVRSGSLLFTAVTDPLELGFAREAMLVVTVEGAHLEQVTEELKQVQEIYYLVSTAGGSDLLCEVIGDSDAHLLEIVTRKIKPLPGVVSVHTYLYLRTEKQAYDWGVR